MYTFFIENILKESGKIALKSFGEVQSIIQKNETAQIVTQVDTEIETYIISEIEKNYPKHSIISEEIGLIKKDSEFTWIVDPLDGTSNYAAGIPWYGIMIALLKHNTPIASGIFLPSTNEMYLAEINQGATKNGKKIYTSTQTDLSKCLVGFSADPASEQITGLNSKFYEKLLLNSRNIRSTNSAVDYAYTSDGRLDALINTNNALWDIAPILLIAQESGAVVTQIDGKNIDIDLENIHKKYTLFISNIDLHSKIAAIFLNILN